MGMQRRSVWTSASGGAEGASARPDDGPGSDAASTSEEPAAEASVVEATEILEGQESEESTSSGRPRSPEELDAWLTGAMLECLAVEADTVIERLLPTPPLSTSLMAQRGYTLLAGAHAVAGAAVLACAIALPSLLLPGAQSACAGPLLLVFLAAHLARASALLLFLADSVRAGELCTWRHQRVNITLGVAAAAAVVCQALGVMACSPAMTILILAVTLPTATFCGAMLKSAASLGETFSWVVDWTRPEYTAHNLAFMIERDLSTLPGALLAALTIGCGAAGASLLVPGGFAAGLYGGGAGSWLALRGIAGGCGLLVSAALCHALLEFAPTTVGGSSLGVARAAVQGDLSSEDRLHAAVRPPPHRFTGMHVTLLAAAALQAYALCQVHAWGADVNVDAALWAPLYASTAVSLVYAGAVAMSASWREVWGGANGLLMAAMSVVAVAYDNLVYRWEYSRGAR